MTIKIDVRIYKTEKRARQRLNSILAAEKNVHEHFKTYPKLRYDSKYKRWVLTRTFVYIRKKLGRKRKRR